MPEGTVDQARYRRNAIKHDQFGRAWATVIEIATGDPITVVPYGGWSDPLATPPTRLRVPRDATGRPIEGRIHVDFDGWIAEIKESYSDWRKFLYAVGKKIYKKATQDEVANWINDPNLLEEAGPKPGAYLCTAAVDLIGADEDVDPVDILKYAKAGEFPALLGLAEVSLEKPTTNMRWPQFRSWCASRGMGSDETSAAWAVYKTQGEEMREVITSAEDELAKVVA